MMTTVGIDYDPFKNGQIEHIAKTTALQKEIWLGSQFNEDSSLAYIQGVAFSLDGQLQEGYIKQALELFCQKHPLTQATFSPDGAYICILKDVEIGLSIDDQSNSNESDFQKYFSGLKQKEARSPFDLTFGPLIRATLLKRNSNQAFLLVTSHHIVCDGGSLRVLATELPIIYGEIESGKALEAKRPGATLEIIQRYFNDSEVEKSKEFWKTEYQDIPNPTEFPASPNHTRPAIRTFNSNRLTFQLSQECTDALDQAKKTLGCTLPVFAYTVLATLIHRLTNQTDLTLGLPISSRIAPQHREVFGQFASLLPIRLKFPEKISFSELLESTSKKVYSSSDHSSVAYNEILSDINFKIDKSRVPLTSITININEEERIANFGSVNGRYDYLDRASETFEIAINLLKSTSDSVLKIDYNSDIFSEDSMKDLAESFQKLSILTSQDATQDISSYSIVPDQQIELMRSWNQQAVKTNNNDETFQVNTIHGLFELQVKNSPDSSAVVFEGEQLTYDQLNRAANQLAHFLTSNHDVSGKLVGLCMDRSEKMWVALLGILKAGAAYLPLDPEYPKDRNDYILSDAGAELLLTESKIQSVESFIGNKVNLDELWNDLHQYSESSPEIAVEENARCYVIYTSGSTGRPKGVQIAHRNVANLLRSMAVEPGMTAQDKLLALTTISFDLAVPDLYLPLAVGAEIQVVCRDTSRDGEAIISHIENNGTTFMQATPSTWRMILQSGWNGGPDLTGIIGGEALPKELLPDLLPKISELWNMYGPTETTVWSTGHRITDSEETIYVGKALFNTQLYVLDSKQSQLPLETPGELYIGGDGVSLGYLGRKDLTDERFVTVQTNEGAQKTYRTGDLVRLHRNGSLEYLNRLDNQVKIRGFRIELGEIETALAKLEGISQGVVIAHQFAPSDYRLVAYTKTKANVHITSTEMRKQLRLHLPDYMVPQFFVELDEFPLTPSGKIDRKSLPNPAPSLSSQQASAPPTTEIEIALADLWKATLKIDQVDLNDFFFDIGGHSLLAVEVVRQIQKEFGVKAVSSELLMNSFSQIAAKIEAETAPKISRTNTQQADGIQPPKKSLLSRIFGK